MDKTYQKISKCEICDEKKDQSRVWENPPSVSDPNKSKPHVLRRDLSRNKPFSKSSLSTIPDTITDLSDHITKQLTK